MNILVDLGALAVFISGSVVFFAQTIRSLFAININDAKGKNKYWMTAIRLLVAVLTGLAIFYGLAGSVEFLGYPLWVYMIVAIPIGIFGKAAETIFIQIGKVTISANLSTSVSEVAQRKNIKK